MKNKTLRAACLLTLFVFLFNENYGQVKTRKFTDGVPSNYLKKKIDQIPVFKAKAPATFREHLENPDKF
jgi:hypothetical protein